ncbi:hypothetical protein [uncultured Mediterranea sp.]|uniref:hypothetical protein n=1 Tax=uncultured Mediterranea sp. TaxID=1926662 RepID=UPI002805A36D|nr:hypothetical protein [uncultured Mediterranea sp.]
MKRCFSFLKNYLATNRLQYIKGPLSIFEQDNDDIDQIDNFPAIYFFVSRKQHFILPTGTSPIIYIGKSDKLRTRLLQHINHYRNDDPKNYWSYSRYNYMRMEGGTELYYLRIQGKENSKALESKVLENYYDKYKALPVGNGAFSYR